MASREFDLYVEGLNDVLRGLSKLPKVAGDELREASGKIATNDMLPSWQNAALYYAGPWGPRIAESIRVKRDRIPSLSIGYSRRAFSGGASSIMVRYPADKGQQGKSGPVKRNEAGRITGGVPDAFGDGTSWISRRRSYAEPAMRKWSAAVDDVIAKWSTL